MEKEAFIHGALCISYSGECLFSSMIMDRSGNRGECAQMCRLPFKLLRNDTVLETNGDYLLSTKELNSSYDFKSILDSDILSLKVEGRMKSPEYVGCVTSLYRDLLDKYYRGEELIPNKEIYNDLKVIFNREYTKGFINNASDLDVMNFKSSNHLGVHLGKVVDADKKYIYVKLDQDLNQGDGIRFNRINDGMIANFIMDRRTNLINKGEKNQVVLFDNKFRVKVGDTVNKTQDVLVIDKYRNIDYKKISKRSLELAGVV
jgi:putative protease